MIARSPHTTVTPELPVHRFGEANREPLQPSTEAEWPIGLDEQMHVIALQAEVEHAKVFAIRRAERALENLGESIIPEGRNVDTRTQRDMGRTMTIVRGPATMRHRGSTERRLATGAGPATAPESNRKRELFGLLAHLIRAMIITN